MTAGANGRSSATYPSRSEEHLKEGPLGVESREDAAHAVPQWAWSTARGHYDWMDSHAPFFCLD